MTRTIVLLAALALLTSASAASASKLPASRYWTTAQAQAAVVAQARIQYCSIRSCVNGESVIGAGTPEPFAPRYAQCRGVGNVVKGKFHEFACAWQMVNDIASGKLEVFTANATKIRWKRG